MARGVAKSYDEVVALAPLDVRVFEGELVALIGHNGSGKSTFLRLAAGLADPSEGSVEVAGAPAGSLEARAALSYLPDAPVLYDDLSVREHLEYVGALHGLGDPAAVGEPLLERFGLAARGDDLPGGFSRGLRQKAALVLALARPWSVLLVDEPFVGLDVSGKAALLDAFDEARAAGRTILVATHDLEVVRRADRCLVLREGCLVRDGVVDPAEVLALAG